MSASYRPLLAANKSIKVARSRCRSSVRREALSETGRKACERRAGLATSPRAMYRAWRRCDEHRNGGAARVVHDASW